MFNPDYAPMFELTNGATCYSVLGPLVRSRAMGHSLCYVRYAIHGSVHCGFCLLRYPAQEPKYAASGKSHCPKSIWLGFAHNLGLNVDKGRVRIDLKAIFWLGCTSIG